MSYCFYAKEKGEHIQKTESRKYKEIGKIAKANSSCYLKNHAFVESAICSVKNVLFAVFQQQHSGPLKQALQTQ